MSAEGEHDQGDEGVGVLEPEGHPGAESDFGVDRFGAAVGQFVFDGGQDRGALLIRMVRWRSTNCGIRLAAAERHQRSRAGAASSTGSLNTVLSPSLSW